MSNLCHSIHSFSYLSKLLSTILLQLHMLMIRQRARHDARTPYQVPTLLKKRAPLSKLIIPPKVGFQTLVTKSASDGAVFKEQKMAGVGILIRDAEGQLIGACSKKLEAPFGAIEAEAKAVELGLQFARDMSIQDFTLESDSLVLVNALRGLSPPPISVANLVCSSVAEAHCFRCVDFAHVGRNGNRPAHLLARHALGIANLSVWVEETPCFLEQALNHDVIALSSV